LPSYITEVVHKYTHLALLHISKPAPYKMTLNNNYIMDAVISVASNQSSSNIQ